MKKQPEMTALTRKKLIDAYFDITARGEKATVGAITGQSGYNRCTFYRYFTDTEQLLDEVETEICGAFQSALQSCSPAGFSAEVMEALAEVYRRYGPYLKVLLGENGDFRFAGRMKALVYPVAAPLIMASADSKVAAELKMEFALSAVLAVVTKWYAMGQPVSALQLGKLIRDIFQRGLFDGLPWG